MCRYWLVLVVLLPMLTLASVPTSCPQVQVCFTPGQACTQQLIKVLDKAQHSILIQAYSFTSMPIAKAVLAAKKRGVEVKLILDKTWLVGNNGLAVNSAMEYLYENGIPIWIDYQPRNAHNKVMIVDSEQVITGSFNFTVGAEYRNTENLLVISSRESAQQYEKNWQARYHLSKAVPPYNPENPVAFNQFKQWLQGREAKRIKAKNHALAAKKPARQ